MEMNKETYLKKALLDTQERVRDYMNYSEEMEEEELKCLFSDFAVVEGEHARQLQMYIGDKE